MLDLVTTTCLHSLKEYSDLIFTAVMTSSSFDRIPRRPSPKKMVVDVTVNICGPEELAGNVGETLSAISVYLQHPVFLEAGIPYINPHYFYPENSPSDLRHLIGLAKMESRLTRISRGIDTLMESLNIVQHLTVHGERADVGATVNGFLVNTQLKWFCPPGETAKPDERQVR